MKNKIYTFIIILLLLTSCNKNDNPSSEQGSPDDISLSEFIIGEWVGSKRVTDIHGSYDQDFYIHFIDDHKLILQMQSPYDDGFNAEFEYNFIEDDKLLVENDRAKGGTWDISREEEKLRICIWNDANCTIFSRVSD